MKKVVILLLAVTLLFTYIATSNSQESIVVCATTEQYRVEDLLQAKRVMGPKNHLCRQSRLMPQYRTYQAKEALLHLQ